MEIRRARSRVRPSDVARFIAIISLAVAVAALATAIVALRQASDQPALGVVSAASIQRVQEGMRRPNRLTRDDVRAILGNPATVFCKSARAECWAYSGPSSDSRHPYEVRIWFGPKRNVAGLAYSRPMGRRA